MIIIGDGIFERLQSIDILKYIWSFKKRGVSYYNVHSLCGNIVDGILKYSMKKMSYDNVSAVIIAFKNFEYVMKDPNFASYTADQCDMIPEAYDFYELQ